MCSHCVQSNERAIKCYSKVGFVQEGVLKEHHFNKGEYEDVIVMAVTKDELSN